MTINEIYNAYKTFEWPIGIPFGLFSVLENDHLIVFVLDKEIFNIDLFQSCMTSETLEEHVHGIVRCILARLNMDWMMKLNLIKE